MGRSGQGRKNHTRPLIRAVTFDVGGTLIHPAPSVGHIYAAVAARHGCKAISPEELNRRFAAAWARLRGFSHTYAQWAALVDDTFTGLTEAPPSQTFFPELYDRFARADAWAVFPDVPPALNQLAHVGLKLGIISNWDERLRTLLQELKLGGYFQAIIVSCEAGTCKPAREIFTAAAKELKTPPHEILHVGDSYQADVLGAAAAGMHSVLVARESGIENPPAVSRDGSNSGKLNRVNALTELFRLLQTV